jgi:hypothetical protein
MGILRHAASKERMLGKMQAGWHQKKLMLKERMRLKIRELGESFAFATRLESLSLGESDQCASRACALQMGGNGAGIRHAKYACGMQSAHA